MVLINSLALLRRIRDLQNLYGKFHFSGKFPCYNKHFHSVYRNIGFEIFHGDSIVKSAVTFIYVSSIYNDVYM